MTPNYYKCNINFVNRKGECVYDYEKKIRIFILGITLFISICFFTLGCTAKHIVVNVIADEAIDGAIANRVMDIVFEEFPEVSSYQLGNVQQSIKDNPSINKITERYIDSICDSIVNNEAYHSPNISVELDQLVDENMVSIEKYIGVKITDSQKKDIHQKLKTERSNIEKTLEKVAYNLASDPYQKSAKTRLLKLYTIINSMYFNITFIFISVLCMVGMKRLNSSYIKTSKQLSIIFMSIGFSFMILLPIFFERIGMDITNRFLGRTMIIDFTLIKNFGYSYFLIGLVLLFVYLVVKNKIFFKNIE